MVWTLRRDPQGFPEPGTGFRLAHPVPRTVVTEWRRRGWRDQYLYGTPLSPGQRRPYRVGPVSPSPSYTSDSENTLTHKRRYRRHAVRVGQRLYGRVLLSRRRSARLARYMACWVLKLKGGDANVTKLVLAFLPSHHSVTGRLLPEFGRWGIEAPSHAADLAADPWDASTLEDDRQLNRWTGG